MINSRRSLVPISSSGRYCFCLWCGLVWMESGPCADVCLVFRYAFGTKDVMNLLLLIIGIIWNYLIISGFISKNWYLYGFHLIT